MPHAAANPAAPASASPSSSISSNGIAVRSRSRVASEAARASASAFRSPPDASLVDEAGDHVPVAARHLHLRAGIEHQEAFAVGVRLHLADEVEIDDG